MIYLDNAATTVKKPECVYEAVLHAMRNYGNSGRGFCDSSLAAAREIYKARSALCEFFGGSDPARLVFTANATESLNIAIRGLIAAGDHVITTDLEHNSVLRPLYEHERQGASLSVVKSDEKGCIDPAQIEAAIKPNTRAIVCTHASNLTGNITDIEEIGRIARKHGLLFIADASQTAGVIPIDVERMNIDVLCFTGHKSLFGPQGTGGMYVGERADIRPLLSGGTGIKSFLKQQPEAYPERLEAGTLNSHGIAGLLAGLRWINETKTEQIYQREHKLMMQFYEAVRDVSGVRVYGDFGGDGLTDSFQNTIGDCTGSFAAGNTPDAVSEFTSVGCPGADCGVQSMRCPVVALNIGSLNSSEVSEWLSEEYGIVTRPGAHCTPLMHEHFKTQAQGMVRFSFSYFNTEEEVAEAARAVAEIARQCRDEDAGADSSTC